MNYLSAHFTLEELIESDYAIRHGIDNIPNADVCASLELLAAGLERVRTVLAVPLYITSGYRCPKLNSALGGSVNSQHMTGLAADFKAPAYGEPREIAQAILDHEDFIGFDQLIHEGAWVHVSFSDRPRGDVLTAHWGGGSAVYSRGIA